MEKKCGKGRKKMDRDSIVNELEKMYANYYNTPDGCCRHFEECKVSGEICKFSADKAMVGANYGNDKSIPRIVFVGLEGTDKDSKKLSIRTPSNDASNPHYRGVRYVLAYLLSKYSNEPLPRDAQIDTLNDPIYQKHLQDLCLINMYKCAFTERSSGLPHSKKMNENCQRILLDEIEVLQPDFLVVQVVSNYPAGLWKTILDTYSPDDNIIATADKKGNTMVKKLVHKNGKPFYYINTYHGNGFPYPHGKGGIFVNNESYIKTKLNPVLDAAVEAYKSSL